MPILCSRPPPSHGHGCDFVLVRSNPFQKAGRERSCIHTGVWKKSSKLVQNRPKFGWYGKVNQKSGRFANVLFHSRMNRKGRSSSGPLFGPVGFPWVHKCIHLRSWLLCPSVLEELFSCCFFFFIFRNKLLNFNFSGPQNSFF